MDVKAKVVDADDLPAGVAQAMIHKSMATLAQSCTEKFAEALMANPYGLVISAEAMEEVVKAAGAAFFPDYVYVHEMPEEVKPLVGRVPMRQDIVEVLGAVFYSMIRVHYPHLVAPMITHIEQEAAERIEVADNALADAETQAAANEAAEAVAKGGENVLH